MRKLGEDISELLDFIPGYFKVLRHVRPKLSCAHCSRVIQLPAPSRPIERGMPAPGLLAQVIVAKYADHCPLYRQQGIYRRSGVDLDRATLADWVAGASRLLEPLVDRLGRYVRAADKVHADDTPVPVLDPGRGKTKTGRVWTYVRDDRPAGSRDPPAVWYRYSPDRKAQHPRAHLRKFCGILQADAYSGFSALYAERAHPGGFVLGARATQVLRHLRREPLADRSRGDPAHRRAVCDRARDSWKDAHRACGSETRARRVRCSSNCTRGSRRRCARCRRSRRLAWRSTTRWCAGLSSPAIATMGASRSTTTVPSVAFVPSCWVGATTCSPVRMPVASGRPTSTA